MADLDLQALFDAQMRDLDVSALGDKLAVAVSGGSDSMALALLAAEWATGQGREVIALCVDHGLRPDSAAEALQVSKWLAGHSIDTHILRWNGPFPKTGIQSAAREARYALMTDFCCQEKISAVLLGHQMEDQAETVLMRLSKGSGLDGLSAIRKLTTRDGVNLIRPLLDIERRQLRNFLRNHGQSWIEDPSNENPAFTRTHLGPVLAALQQLPGSEPRSLSLSAKRLGRAADALAELTNRQFQEICQVSPFGFVQMPDLALRNCPDEIGLRLLSRSLSLVSGRDEQIKLSALERLYDRCLRQNNSRAETLSGCEIFRSGDHWTICREAGRQELPECKIGAEPVFLWDQRYAVIDLKPDDPLKKDLRVRRIGPDGWKYLKNTGLIKSERTLPAKVRNTLPGIWSDDHLVAAPLFSGQMDQSGIAKGRFKMVFKPLIAGEMAGIINHPPIGT